MFQNNKYFDIADELFTHNEFNEYAKINRYEKNNIVINETTIFTNSNPYSKEKGVYCSFVFPNLSDSEVYQDLHDLLTKYIKEFIKELTKKRKPRILFVGLGNEAYIPDSLGPRVVKNINSNYYYKKKIGCLIPGVMAITGMETSDIIKGVLEYHNYDLVFVIDSLSTTSIDRLNKTIQITDSGISPGSGVKNYRKPISKDELNVNVITLGIATVISYENIINDFLNENNLQCKYLNKNIYLTSKEIELEIENLSYLLSDVINCILN